MKVKCINDYWLFYLTIGKPYVVINDEVYYYYITNDVNNKWSYPKELFKSLVEMRNEKIERLLSE